MIKQTLTFQNPASLSLNNRQLVIKLKDTDNIITRSIEDIGCIVIENQMVSITIPLLNALADNNVAVVFCDGHTMPRSMLMTLEGNKTLQETYRYQIDAPIPTRKNAWKQIIESKIRNQSILLDNIGQTGDILKPYYMNVRSGDTDNREGVAANIYWKALFGNKFCRNRKGESPNNLLNYGYTILRAATARAILGSGLYPAFGIFHRNRYNAFPLADDLMEPYRPFVDELVFYLYYNKNIYDLNKESKATLTRILICDVAMEKVVRPLEIALTMTTASLAKMLKNETNKLTLPILK